MQLKILKAKQEKLLTLLVDCGKDRYNIKPLKQLSPIGWHILHCLYIENFWIKKYLRENNYQLEILDKKFDANFTELKDRGSSLPEFKNIIKLAKTRFKENRRMLKNIFFKNITYKNFSFSYIKDFLVHHHSQHIETIHMILNILNLKLNNSFKECAKIIQPQEYNFKYFHFQTNDYYIGSDIKEFSYDNEKPKNKVTINEFKISKNLINIGEWKAFMDAGGYKKKKLLE